MSQVKAIAWSPHQHGLLASGGGTADRCIRFWNTLTGQPLQSVDTGSQVCNLAWSKHSNELVSTLLLCTLLLSTLLLSTLLLSTLLLYTLLLCTLLLSTLLLCTIHYELCCLGKHSWLFSEPDSCMEIPIFAANGKVDWSLLQSIIFSMYTSFIIQLEFK